MLPVNQSLQALQASAAQVRLEPTTKMPQRNSVFYLRQPGVTRKDFAPRKVCICVHASVCVYVDLASESFEKKFKTWYCKQYPFRAVKGRSHTYVHSVTKPCW